MECQDYKTMSAVIKCEGKMGRPNVTILGVCGTKWVNKGNFVNNKQTFVYVGGEKSRSRSDIRSNIMRKCILLIY